MPSDKHNSITAKATGLIFHCSISLQPDRCLLTYRSMYNAFFMDLPVSSFVSHSSLLTAKSVDLAIAHDGFPFVTEIVHICHSGYFDIRGAFQTVLDSYCCVMG